MYAFMLHTYILTHKHIYILMSVHPIHIILTNNFKTNFCKLTNLSFPKIPEGHQK